MKLLILTELLFIVMSIIGFALRIGLSFWGIPLLIIGLLGLMITYLRRGFKPVLLNNQPDAASDRFFVPVYKLGYIFFAINMFGLLLKTMLWDVHFLGLGVVLLLGYVLFVAVQVLKEKLFFKKILVKSILIGTIALAFYRAPQATFIDIYYRDHPDFAKKFIEYRQDPQNVIKKKNYLEARKKLLEEDEK